MPLKKPWFLTLVYPLLDLSEKGTYLLPGGWTLYGFRCNWTNPQHLKRLLMLFHDASVTYRVLAIKGLKDPQANDGGIFHDTMEKERRCLCGSFYVSFFYYHHSFMEEI